MLRKLKCVIFGGGIGGLSVAHELSKLPIFEVHIFEAKNVIGGMARSSAAEIPNFKQSGKCATELCWRVFFGFYHNMFKIMKEIPITNSASEKEKHKTVHDTLVPYKHINFSNVDTPIKDHLIAYYNIFYGLTSSDARLRDLDYLTWKDALSGISSTSPYRCVGGWLGMDRFKASFNSVIRVGMEMQMVPSYTNPYYTDYLTDRSTSEALFENWETLLRKNGVHFHMNSKLIALQGTSEITSATIRNNSGIYNITADYFVLSMPIEELVKVVENKLILGNIHRLKEISLHKQISFQVYFDRKIFLGGKNAFLIADSAWDLIILSYDQVYSGEICKKSNFNSNSNSVHGCWSIAICTSYVPGIVYGKSFEECSYQEIINELWAQIISCEKLKKFIKKHNKFDLSGNFVIGWSPMWPSYRVVNNIVVTDEPKFTNNAGCLNIRPSIHTKMKNMFIATGYARETIDIFSMEAAAISGTKVANLICQDIQFPGTHVYEVQRPIFFYPLRKFDEIMYSMHLPNIGVFLIILILICMICIIYANIEKEM